MKAKFNGIEIEGTPEEMAQLVKLVSEMPKNVDRTDYYPALTTPYQPHVPWRYPWTLVTSGGTFSSANFPLDTAQQATSTAKAVPQTLTIQA